MSIEHIAALTVFGVAYLLIATERVHRVAAALGGAGVMLALRLTSGETAFFSAKAGIDWNVIFLLFGMMVIVGVISQTGVFEYLAITAVKRVKGRPFGLLTLLVVLTALASAALDNVTTVLLIAPVTFMICNRLRLPPVPYLIAEVMASNIGGTATLIGDPPNIIIGSRAGLSFNDFLIHLAPFIAVLLVVFIGLTRLLFRHAFSMDHAQIQQVMTMSAPDALRDRGLLVKCLVVLVLVLAGFVLHPFLHLLPSVVALLGAGLLVVISRVPAREAVAEVEWETLAFFMGLFIMVGGLIESGAIGEFADFLADATGGKPWLTTVVLLVASALLSGFIDNIPYVATMAPVVGELVQNQPSTHGGVLWWALALGADLGGNLTAVGASANVVVLGLSKRNGTPISFWEFTKYGIVVTAVSVVMALGYLWLRYFAFG